MTFTTLDGNTLFVHVGEHFAHVCEMSADGTAFVAEYYDWYSEPAVTIKR
jgi:hypothetical protein